MRKVIAAINVTLDGFSDHTAVIADDDLLNYFTRVLRGADTILYGRKTYQLMEDAWPHLVAHPSENMAENEFARSIDEIHKVVFTHTLTSLPWKNSRIAARPFREELDTLKNQEGGNILIGSLTFIAEAVALNLADEYQFCVHPVVGKGTPLFRNIPKRMEFRLIENIRLASGAIVLKYQSGQT